MYAAYASPAPEDAWTEMIEIWDTRVNVLIDNDGEVREHPEVPLPDARLDEVLDRLGYRRTGPWQREDDRPGVLLDEAERGLQQALGAIDSLRNRIKAVPTTSS